MLTLIHGDDTASSRNAFLKAKEKAQNQVSFSGDQVNLTDLAQALQGNGLFAEIKAVYIEDLFSKKKGEELMAITSYLTDQGKQHDIFLWEKKILTPPVLKQLKNAAVEVYKLPQELFRFLDAIKPKNTDTISLFHSALETTDSEMLFFMLIRQFRLLLALKETEAPIDEVQKLAPWQKSKLKRQARLFSSNELISVYNRLSKIDRETKTGAATTPLTTTIDFLLLAL
ncbi:MAG: hypothetical protein HY431_02690 [Candidatus Levybacteria bacterium]|nr:hypothetical protein [Candidatus Levybacteria bacterium]